MSGLGSLKWHLATARAVDNSFFRHPGHRHTLLDALAPSNVGGIVTHSASHAAKGESWIERKPRPDRSPRLLQRAEQRKRGGEPKMRDWIISVRLEAPA